MNDRANCAYRTRIVIMGAAGHVFHNFRAVHASAKTVSVVKPAGRDRVLIRVLTGRAAR